jgi:cytochrome b involved in lipid metabolism
MRISISIIIVVLIIGLVIWYFQSNKTVQTQPENTVPTETPENTPEEGDAVMNPSYTLADVAKHSTKEDCWLAINGEVYDTTEFIAGSKHPGGDAILDGCGSNATELFETRPMGSGTAHSERARELLKNYKIGTLAE